MTSAKDALLRHVVLFKFKESATESDLRRLADEFKIMATTKISEVQQYEWGTNISKENLSHGYTHCFFLTFHSEEDRDRYLVHPAHIEFVDLLKPYMESATVIDYWAQ